jgi:hypothetical protein
LEKGIIFFTDVEASTAGLMVRVTIPCEISANAFDLRPCRPDPRTSGTTASETVAATRIAGRISVRTHCSSASIRI